MSNPVTGSCFCGKVSYQINKHLGIFQYCHCSRCRKFTGSAHAANLFVHEDEFRWLSGEAHVSRYNPKDTKYFATAFCRECGSSLPWHSQQGSTIVIPAGTLDESPDLQPQQNIFCASRAGWYAESKDLPHHDALPPPKTK